MNIQGTGILLLAGLAAGAMNAMAGGGTFVAFPALLGSGLAATTANATSNAALLPGAMASAWTYRAGLVRFGPLGLRTMVLITALGGGLGALLLYLTDEATFRAIIPWLLLAASLVLTFGQGLRRRLEAAAFSLGPRGAAALQLMFGIYGGYFGGAVGLLMMAGWVLISDRSVKDLAPARTLMLATANGAALVLFVALGLVAWAQALPVAVGAVAGGVLGARLAMRLPAAAVRVAVLVTTYGTTAAFFWRAYGP